MKKYLIQIVCLVISQGYSFAQQQTWSLEECIRYAIDHNIQIKQQVIQTMYQKNALDLSKLSLLPTLNGQATHNYSFGRALMKPLMNSLKPEYEQFTLAKHEPVQRIAEL
jgi:outer membrane protein